jgi:hypothetical protein
MFWGFLSPIIPFNVLFWLCSSSIMTQVLKKSACRDLGHGIWEIRLSHYLSLCDNLTTAQVSCSLSLSLCLSFLSSDVFNKYIQWIGCRNWWMEEKWTSGFVSPSHLPSVQMTLDGFARSWVTCAVFLEWYVHIVLNIIFSSSKIVFSLSEN